MVKYILLIVLALIVGLIVAICLQPATYRVSRSTTIAAPPAAVFAQINDFHRWEAWSPWAKLDPAMKQGYEGPAAGPGAIYTWEGNNNVGQGRMTIRESKPDEQILIDLEFIKPMPGLSLTEFALTPEAGGTRLSWTMSGPNSFMGKAMSLFVGMDKMVGGQFEQGLAALKSIVETK